MSRPRLVDVHCPDCTGPEPGRLHAVPDGLRFVLVRKEAVGAGDFVHSRDNCPVCGKTWYLKVLRSAA